ncbi:MAG TPA: glycosyltransferase family 2 protein [Candidatus Nanoarchaeia archaeon]|nr:glycosyltransferase family 2 protein [Candidatus Nanoarchaeia archaeon]
MAKISVVIPIYNEEESIADTIERIQKVSKKIKHDVEIIAVNDASKDNSLQILKKISGIKIVSHPYNLGYGASVKDGIRAATGEWIMITDADGTYPIEDMPKLVEHIPQYDMVVGARTGKEVHIPLMRRPAKWIINKLANFLSGHKIDDINSGMRIFNKEKAMEFIKLYPSGVSFTSTITLAFFTSDYTVKYIPTNYYKRIGKSTIKPIKDFIGFITLIFKIVMYFRPLKFFLAPSMLLILFGIGYGTYQTMTSSTGIGQLPMLAVITGIQLVFLGFIAEMVAKK